MRNVMLAVFTIVMLVGTAVNIGCVTSDENCDDPNVRIVESGSYEVQNRVASAEYEGVLFQGADQVQLDRSFDGSNTTFFYEYNGVEERWTTEQ